eukprot:g119.t1
MLRKLLTPTALIGNRSSYGLSALDNVAYLFGGEMKARTPIEGSNTYTLALSSPTGNEGQEFKPELISGEWKEMSIEGEVKPPPRLAHAQCIAKNKKGNPCLFVHGGRQGVSMGEKPLNDLWALDLTEKTWKEIKAPSGPSPRSFHRMEVNPKTNSLFVFGGCGADGRLADLHEFLIDKDTWRTWETCPCDGRGGPGFFVVNNVAYVVSGFAGKPTNDAYMLDVKTFPSEEGSSASWVKLSSSLSEVSERSVFAQCVLARNNKEGIAHLVMIGGELEPSEKGHEGAGMFTNEIVHLDINPKDKSWKVTKIVPPESLNFSTRGWFESCVLKYKGHSFILTFGGLSGSDENPTRLGDTWLYNPKPSKL